MKLQELRSACVCEAVCPDCAQTGDAPALRVHPRSRLCAGGNGREGTVQLRLNFVRMKKWEELHMNRKFRLRLLSALAAVTLLAGTAQTVTPVVSFAAANLISNSTFESGTTDWGIYKESGGAAKLTTEDGKLALKITSVGTLNYAVQMFYDIIPLYQNGVYHLHYEISSSVPRYVEGMIQQNGGDYTAYVWDGIDVTSVL